MFASLSQRRSVQTYGPACFCSIKRAGKEGWRDEAGSGGSPVTAFMKVGRFRDFRKWYEVKLKGERKKILNTSMLFLFVIVFFLKVGAQVIDCAPHEPGD